jgi:hypothetical protein
MCKLMRMLGTQISYLRFCPGRRHFEGRGDMADFHNWRKKDLPTNDCPAEMSDCTRLRFLGMSLLLKI